MIAGAVHLPAYPRRPVPPGKQFATLNPKVDLADAEKRYASESPSFVVIDDLLEHKTLQALYEMCLESTFWFEAKTQIFEPHTDPATGHSWPRHEAGYLGAYDFAGFNQPLLMQVAEEIKAALPGVIGTHELAQAWAYKYDETMHGVQVHADAAAINVNLWLTPDIANLDHSTGGGGLVVFKDLRGDDLMK